MSTINEPFTTNTNEQNAFFLKIKEYVKENNPSVCILTPCYGGVCYVNYVHCLMLTISLFQQFNITVSIEFCKNDSLVTRARNNLIAKALSNRNTTHIMFIDNDITWDPIDIIKLLLSDKSLIGGIYPLKKYNWSNLLKDPKNPENNNAISSMITRKNNSQLKNIISDEDMVQYNLLKYNTNFLNNNLKIENNLTVVRHIATGFMMIKRNTLEQLIIAFPETKYEDDVGFLKDEEQKYAYALFDCGVEEGHYFSEDWLFCHRWSKMGGNIYVDVTINLKHTGTEDFNGSFIASLI